MFKQQKLDFKTTVKFTRYRKLQRAVLLIHSTLF